MTTIFKMPCCDSFTYSGGYILIFSILISTFPFYMYTSYWKDALKEDILPMSLKSDAYRFSLVSGIAASLPPFLELLTDLFISSGKYNQRSFFPISYILCLIVPNLISLLYVSPYSATKFYLWMNCVRLFLILFSVAYFLSQFSPKFWRTKWLTFSVSSFYLGSAIDACTPYFINGDYLSIFTGNIGTVLEITGAIVFIVLTFQFLSRNTVINDQSDEQMVADDIYCRFAALCTVIMMLGVFTLHVAYGAPYWTDWDAAHITYFCYIQSAPNIAMSVLFAHTIRNEAVVMQKVKQMFVRYISHEMRTPLNTAVMGLQYLRSELMKSSADSELLGIVDEVRGACEISVTILNEMLDYDKLQSGGMKLELEELAVKEFLETTISPFYVQANQKSIQLCCNLESTSLQSLHIEADKNKLAQVIRNLLSNAIKFTPSGGLVRVIATVIEENLAPPPPPQYRSSYKDSSVNYTTTTAPVTYSLRIDVIDTGVGVSKENQSKLFKEIIQFNPGKLQSGGGSGLGLFISKGIMDLHDGSLSITSEGEGSGCTFTVLLHAKYAPPATDPAVLFPDDRSGVPGRRSSGGAAAGAAGGGDVPLPRRGGGGGGGSAQEPIAPSSQSNWRSPRTIKPNTKMIKVLPLAAQVDNEDTIPSPTTTTTTTTVKKHPLDFIEVSDCSDMEPPPLHRALVVDDSASNRKMLVRLLRDRCCLIRQAVDGVDAVRQVKAGMEAAAAAASTNQSPQSGNDRIDPASSSSPPTMFDVVFMDFIMPNMEGPEAARELRELGYTGLIIGITGNAMPSDKERFISQGADIVLTKPVDIRDINNAFRLIK